MISLHHRQLTFYVFSRLLGDFFVHLDCNNNLDKNLTDSCGEVCTIERWSCSQKKPKLARKLALDNAPVLGTFHWGSDDGGDDDVVDEFSQPWIFQPLTVQPSIVADEALHC